MHYLIPLSLLAFGSFGYARPLAELDRSVVASQAKPTSVIESRDDFLSLLEDIVARDVSTDNLEEPVQDAPERRATQTLGKLASRSTAPGRTCTTSASSNRFTCGEAGALGSPRDYTPSEGQPDSSVDTAQLCGDACSSDMGCLSFSFDQDTLKCTLFDKILSRQGFAADSASRVIFTDRRCVRCKGTRTGPIIKNGFFQHAAHGQFPWITTFNSPFDRCNITESLKFNGLRNPALECSVAAANSTSPGVSIEQTMHNLVVGQSYTVQFRYQMQRNIPFQYMEIYAGGDNPNPIGGGEIPSANTWLQPHNNGAAVTFVADYISQVLSIAFTNANGTASGSNKFDLDAVKVFKTPRVVI